MDNLTINYPEMHGNSNADIQAETTCLTNKPYRVTSKFQLPITQGVSYNGQVGVFGSNNVPNKRAGYYKYYLTRNAFNRLIKNHLVVLNCLLD